MNNAMNIHILPSHIANQIAAGEVVERPSSVVKELIENSLDAGADAIDVEITDGGRSLIKVMDNGCGMGRSDLELCVESHATSKVLTPYDLDAITTLGFRGEALPSIASVSEMKIRSCAKGSDEAWELLIAYGKDRVIRPCAMTQGTAVEVRDIFLKTPARRRFLRSPSVETSHINRVIRLYSVAFNNVRFSLLSGKKTLFEAWPRNDLISRIEPLINNNDTDGGVIVPVDFSAYGMRLYGGILHGAQKAKKKTKRLYFFINNRPFSSNIIIRAIKDAVKGILMTNEMLEGVIFLKVPYDSVDVNCHPAKQEVRFRRPDRIFKLTYAAIKDALERTMPSIVNGAGIEKSDIKSDDNAWASKYPDIENTLNAAQQCPYGGGQAIYGAQELYKEMEADEEEGEKIYDRQTGMDAADDMNEKIHDRDSLTNYGIEPLGTVFDTFIIARKADELILIDQHAAHEALIFKHLINELRQNKKMVSQALSFPVVIDCSPYELENFELVRSGLQRLGFACDIFGASSIIVREAPALIARLRATERSIRQIIFSAIKDASFLSEDSIEKFTYDIIAKTACSEAIKAGDKLNPLEIITLIDDITSKGISHCPHGRPIFISFTREELERLFKRRR